MAEVNLSNNADIDGILWGYRIDGTNLTYSFPTGTGDYTDYEEIKGFEAFNADQQAAVTRILAQVSGVCGLNFTLATTGRATLRFAEATEIDYTDAEGGLHKPGSPNDSAEANPPDPDYAAHIRGDCWFNRTNYNDPDPGDFAFAAGVMHEIGHALGLKHGHQAQTEHGVNFPVLPSDHDSQEYSIMTYRRYPGGPATGSSAADYPQTLMQNDIAALQYMYGADYGYNNGNNTYSWSPTTGEMFIDGAAQGLAPGGGENFIFLTIWDGWGIDTYDFSNYTTNLVVDLNPGAWSRVSASSNLQRADLGDGKFARGNIANALLHQDNGAALIERAIGGTGRDSITGNRADNELFGQASDDTLLGGAGRDRLDGGTAADAMAGGAGDDTYVVDNVGDAVIEWSGEGFDTISAWISTWMPENTEMLRLEFDPRAITATGSFGNDRIEGNAFNNVINGSAGWDSMLGRAGNDTYYVENVFDAVVETYGEGTDTVISSVSHTLADNVEILRLSGAEPLAGAGNNWDNTLVGNIGANRLDGAGGLDTLQGGLGDDTYVLDDLGLFIYDDETFFYLYDRVVEAANGGVDTVEVALVNALHFASYLLPANIENGRVIGAGAFDLNGNARANALTGNGAVNRLNGGDGNDLLDGGAGEDTLTGGAGNDVFLLTDANFRELGEDSFDFFYDAVVEAANGGIDTVRVARAWGTYGYTLPTHVENGVVIGTEAFDLAGNGAANLLIGNDAANVLRGGAGIDRLYGRGGNDWFYVDHAQDRVYEAAGGGADRLDSSVSYVLQAGAEVETLVAQGFPAVAINLTGNAFANAIYGNGANNVLNGGAGDDRLLGGDGNDVLNGGAGADRMEGGAGNDLFYIDRGQDVVVEAAGQGADRIVSALSYSLAALPAVENLTLIGAALNGAGNAAANVIVGNAAANALSGAGGNDVLAGGAGNDLLRGGAGNDRFLFADLGGDDRISDFAAGAGRGDVIDLRSDAQIDSFADVLARTVQSGANCVINLGQGDSLTLLGVAKAALAANDFLV